MNFVPDPLGALSAVAMSLPGGAMYLPMILAYLALVGGVCTAVIASVQPPTSTSSPVWLTAYRIINFMAGNFGHARNAVPAGLPPTVAGWVEAASDVTAAVPAAAAAQASAQKLT